MLVVHFSGATGVTISNSDFDGNTKFSASCDGHHYWGFLLYGKTTQISLLGNYIHTMSGRGPKIGGAEGQNVVVHAANNYFDDNTGHAFDVAAGAYALTEGNYFSSVKMHDPAGNFFVPVRESNSKRAIGRACKLNVLIDSGKLTSYSARAALGEVSKYSKQIGGYVATEAAQLSVASGNFGVGVLASAVASTLGDTATNNKDASAAVKEAESSSKNTTQGDTTAIVNATLTGAPTGTVAPYTQISVQTEAPANEADEFTKTKTTIVGDPKSNDVTQGEVQSTEARSTAICKLRKRH